MKGTVSPESSSINCFIRCHFHHIASDEFFHKFDIISCEIKVKVRWYMKIFCHPIVVAQTGKHFKTHNLQKIKKQGQQTNQKPNRNGILRS